MSKLIQDSRASFNRAGQKNNPISAAIFAALFSALVAGCGGGGGASQTADTTQQQVAPATPMAQILAAPCTAGPGENSCASRVSVTSQNVAKSTLNVNVSDGNQFAVPTNTTATATVVVPVGTVTLQTDYGGSSPAVATVTVTCATGLSVDPSTGKCTAPPPVLSGDVWYEIRTTAGLMRLDPKAGTATPVANATGVDFINLRRGNMKAGDGTTLFVATETKGYTTVYFALKNDGALHMATDVPQGLIGVLPPGLPTATASDGTMCIVPQAYDPLKGYDLWDVMCSNAAGQPLSTIVGVYLDNVIDVFVVTF